MAVTLRPVTPEDDSLLCRVYGSTRETEMALVPWTDDEKAAFIRMQFEAQSAHYAKYYPNAEYSVIERDRVPIGRLYVHRGTREIRIVDIALLPEARGAGIGTSLLLRILTDAAQAGQRVSIHVESFNPALRLYERLGFRHVQDHGMYYLMQWAPPDPSGDQPKIAS